MQRNTELAEQTMQYIMDHPKEWVQHTYGRDTACGTVGCFAFHAVRLSGRYRHLYNSVWQKNRFFGGVSTSSEAARVELGLTYDEAAWMFSGDNSMDELRVMVKNFVNGDEVSQK